MRRLATCLSGKSQAKLSSQAGILPPNMNTSEMKESGMMAPFVTATVVCTFGSISARARPSALNARELTTSVTARTAIERAGMMRP